MGKYLERTVILLKEKINLLQTSKKTIMRVTSIGEGRSHELVRKSMIQSCPQAIEQNTEDGQYC